MVLMYEHFGWAKLSDVESSKSLGAVSNHHNPAHKQLDCACCNLTWQHKAKTLPQLTNQCMVLLSLDAVSPSSGLRGAGTKRGA